jgi:hypothetical protein
MLSLVKQVERGEGALDLIGSRTTLIANVCAMIAAFVTTAEGAYFFLLPRSRHRSIHLIPYACGGRLVDPHGNVTPFFVISVICLAIYVAGALAKFIVAFIVETWDRAP